MFTRNFVNFEQLYALLFALQEKLLNRRHESQKAAAYNLATGEAVAVKNKVKNQDYFVSFVVV